MVMTAVTIETAKSLGEKYYSAHYLPHPLLKPETSKIGPRQNYLVATTRACGNYYNDVSKSENSQGNRSCLQRGIQFVSQRTRATRQRVDTRRRFLRTHLKMNRADQQLPCSCECLANNVERKGKKNKNDPSRHP